ncbi:hypothetical protein [Agromyces sp. NPDC058110]|uniref:hypothetical protein n=1 Tax=Agromyces sp. NPDC058110 TaxID=3346345 RepID=UPI0036DBC89C
MSGDRQGGDGADWLLAQLAAGGGAPRPQHPVTPPSFGQPAPSGEAPIAPTQPFAPAPAPSPAPAPRRNEEVLDWFSLAEPPARDTGTRALPVVGEVLPPAAPSATGAPFASQTHPQALPIVPPAQSAPAWNPTPPAGPSASPQAPVWQTPATPAAPPAAWPAAPAAPAAAPHWAPTPAPGSPSASPQPPAWNQPAQPQVPAWNQPAEPQVPAWNQPVQPQPSSHAPLTVEPPVGRPPFQPAEPTPAAWESAQAQQHQPAEPVVPGPATPTGPFALTWGEPEADSIDSEDALRAAFRRLSQPEAPPAAVPQAFVAPAEPAMPAHPAANPAPEAFAATTDDDGDDSPFAGFAPPPVARSSFTPVTPATASGDFGADLWSAMQETEVPSVPSQPAPELTRRERLALEQQQSAAQAEATDVAHTRAIPVVDQASQAPQVETPWYEAQQVTPEAPQPAAFDAPRTPFPAFAAAPAEVAPTPAPAQPVDDLLAALGGGAAASFAAGAASSASAAPAPAAPAPAAPAPEHNRFAAFAAFTEETAQFEARTPAEPRHPFDALDQAEPEPVDAVQPQTPEHDPFAAFAARQAAEPDAAGRPAFDAQSLRGPQVDDEPDGLAGLGLAFDDDPIAAEPEPFVPQFGTARAWSAVPAEADDEAAEADDEEPVYQWGIRPDPTADDPHADAPMGSPLRSLAFGGAAAAAAAPIAPVVRSAAPVADPIDEAALESEPFGADGDWFTEPAPEEPTAATAMLPVVPAQHDPAPTEAFSNDPFAFADGASNDPFAFADEPDHDPFANPAGATQRLPIAPTESWNADRQPDAVEPDDDNPFASLFAPTGPVGVAAGAGVAGASAASGRFGAFAAASGSGSGASGSGGAFGGAAGGAGGASGGATGPMRGGASGGHPGGSGGGYSGGSSSGGSGSGSGGKGGSDTGSGGRGPAKPLIWVAGGLLVLVVLAGLFFFGTKLVGGDAAASLSPSASESDAASDTPAPEPTAPQPMGVHAWNTLFGGECLDPFASAWEEEYTVVDCGVAHAAQLVYRGTLPGDEAAAFPGEAELGAQMNTLCTAAGIVDVAAASGVPDLQVQGSYPVTEEQWAAGERTYYCFANRAGGEPLTGSIAGPGPSA